MLDLGGGPGRYALALAERGHEVTLADLSEKHVGIAKDVLGSAGFEDTAERAVVADATELDHFEADSFDAVVAFGPFYHITDRDQLEQTAREVSRVTVDDGVLFAQFLPPLTGYIRALERAANHPGRLTRATLRTVREECVFHNASNEGYQEGIHIEIDDAVRLFNSVGYSEADLLSVRGIAAWHEDELAEIQENDEALYEDFLDLVEETCRRRAAIEMGAIALYVGRL